jgi:hypothetical protein
LSAGGGLLVTSPISRPRRRETANVIRAATRLLVLAVLALVALPGSAMAAPNPIADCNDNGVLDNKYSNERLRKALEDLPTDLDEYSNCREILSGAITSGSDKGGGRPTLGADGSPLPAEEQAARTQDNEDLAAITADPEKSPPSIKVGDEEVEPGSNGLFDLASASNDLPVPLLVALIALALVALIGGLVAMRERIPALARIPLLSKIPTPRVSLPRFLRR